MSSDIDWAGLVAGDTRVCFEHPYASLPTFEQFVETQLQVLGVLFNAREGILIPAVLASREVARYVVPEGDIDLGDYTAALSVVASQIRAERLFIPRITQAAVSSVPLAEAPDGGTVAVAPDDPRLAAATTSLLWFAMERRGGRSKALTGLYPIEDGRTRGDALVMTRQAITMFSGILP